jgi:hypothetical protein
MHRPAPRRARPFVWTLGATLSLLLSACGGGGGGSGGTPNAACSGGATVGIVLSTAPRVGSSASVGVTGCASPVVSAVWTQTAGPTVSTLTAKSAVLSFDPPAAGRYGFRVSATNFAGQTVTADATLDVAAAPAGPALALRLGHAVREGGNVSVRAWPTPEAGDGVGSITWTQTAGPTVTLDTSDPWRALFTAPAVSADTVVRVRATLTTTSGKTVSDEVPVIVQRYNQAPESDANAVWGGTHVSAVRPYRAASPWAGVLTRCVYDAALSLTNLCPLSTLSFIGQGMATDATPTVDQIMDRVLVSHDWVGANFERLLREQDPTGDIRRMLKGVTAVVLGVQVRPSFYYAVTGAIYLDADNFWLTAAERDTLNETPDYRSAFGRTLNYSGLWRYARNNGNWFGYFDSRVRQDRAAEHLQRDAGWLMYHELAHANDFMPPAALAVQGATNDSAWGVIYPRYAAGQLPSDLINVTWPLTSAEMRGLAQVKFRGTTATATQEGWSPQTVAGFFSADKAIDEYAYLTTREDLALNVEAFMMSRRHGVERDVAIADRITDTTTGSTLFVRWGQRTRIADPAIKPRVNASRGYIVPWVAASEMDLLPTPLAMRAGDSWSSNLVLGPVAPGSPKIVSEATLLQDIAIAARLARQADHRGRPDLRFLTRGGEGAHKHDHGHAH